MPVHAMRRDGAARRGSALLAACAAAALLRHSPRSFVSAPAAASGEAEFSRSALRGVLPAALTAPALPALALPKGQSIQAAV